MTTTENTILVRRDTSANWASANPVPKAGEWCFETDTGIAKIGDGTTQYTSLVPVGKTTAATTELNILDGATLTTSELNILDGATLTTTELNYLDGVTGNVQTQLDTKFASADVQTSFGDTPSDEKVASEKLVKTQLDTKQDIIAVNNAILKPDVLSSMNVIGENNEGRAYSEKKTYLKMYHATHTTFAPNKFTVTGSPTVTDNGIAYGFSDSNKLTLTVPKFGSQFKFKASFTTGSDTTTSNQYIFDCANFRYYLVYVGDAYFLPAVYVSDGNGNFYLRDTSETFTLLPNTKYFTEVGYNSNTQLFYIKIFTEDGTMVEDTEQTLTAGINLTTVTNAPAAMGNRSTIGSFAGKIDLKYIELFADNELVFDGNITGVDKISDDNYATVGSPVVTNGIATSLSSANYLQYTSLPALKNTNFWEVVSPVYTPHANSISNPAVFKLLTGSSTNGFAISFNDNGNVTCLLQGPSFTDITRVTLSYSAGNKYRFKWVHNTPGNYECWYCVNEGAWILGNSATSISTAIDTGSNYLQFGINGANLDMNINTMYVAIDDNIVYQPCMYIPYTLSNIGKIADMSARGDVEHYFKQYGAAPYYVIDELNNFFVLPYGSVESKVAPKILVDSYASGTSSWEQYLDGTMIQRGSMTADTPVTFPCSDEFANTNYTLSCPYSAKTKTGFTPTASGEYIAIGQV